MSAPTLAERIAGVRDRIAEACRRAGRKTDEVRLVAVSKTRPAEDIDAAAALGITDFGENRVQEAVAKLDAVRSFINPHLVGHLQGNKARLAVGLFPEIQSVDSIGLAERLSRLIEEGGVTPPGGGPLRVFAQANLAGEEAKFGFAEAELEGALAKMRELPGLQLVGLMLIPPFDPDPEATRPEFARLRELATRLADAGLLPENPELSMGMSHDYAVAITEGATTVRVGTAIFGPRS